METRAALARPAAGAPQKVRTGLHHWQARDATLHRALLPHPKKAFRSETNTLPMTVTHHKVEMVTKIEDARSQRSQGGAHAARGSALQVMQRTRAQITRTGSREPGMCKARAKSRSQ